MTRGGCSSHAGEDVPVCHSARQAGHSPEPYPQPPHPLAHPPTVEQIMHMFEERRSNDLLEVLKSVQAMVRNNGNINGNHSKLSDFQKTNPPSFTQVVDPMEADDWLRTIENKLDIARTEEGDKVPFATHYLEGFVAIWWDNTKAMWPADEEITCDKFKEEFCTYHILAGILKVKQREFLALTQGNLSVTEYLNKFNHLARYSLYYVAMKRERLTDSLED